MDHKFIYLHVYVGHAKAFVKTRVGIDHIGYYREAVSPTLANSGFASMIPEGASTILVLKSERVGLFVKETPASIDYTLRGFIRDA